MNQLVQAILKRIPKGTIKVRVLGRHTMYNSGVPGELATPSPEGRDLLYRVTSFYQYLIFVLQEQFEFGVPVVEHSGVARSMISTWEITKAKVLIPNPLLALTASLMSINNGKWYRSRADQGSSQLTIIREFLRTPALHGQNFLDNADLYRFWCTSDAERFKITFAHEVAASMAVMDCVDTVGLADCQAYLVCVNAHGQILTAIRLVPPGTEE